MVPVEEPVPALALVPGLNNSRRVWEVVVEGIGTAAR